MWLFASTSVLNITEISFWFQFKLILWCFNVVKASKLGKIIVTGSHYASCNKAPLKTPLNCFLGRSGESGARAYYGLKWQKSKQIQYDFFQIESEQTDG